MSFPYPVEVPAIQPIRLSGVRNEICSWIGKKKKIYGSSSYFVCLFSYLYLDLGPRTPRYHV